MLRDVTFEEFFNWFKRNKQHTWHPDNFGSEDPERTFMIKYIDLRFDTRTGRIYHLKTQGSVGLEVDHSEEGLGTILDALSEKIKDCLQKS